jgi:hypothetical protein
VPEATCCESASPRRSPAARCDRSWTPTLLDVITGSVLFALLVRPPGAEPTHHFPHTLTDLLLNGLLAETDTPDRRLT